MMGLTDDERRRRGREHALLNARADLARRGSCTAASGVYGEAYNGEHQALLDHIEDRLAAVRREARRATPEWRSQVALAALVTIVVVPAAAFAIASLLR